MRLPVWLMVAALLVLHQDYFLWDDSRLVFGFVPVALAYHSGLTLVTTAVWIIVTTFFWPNELLSDAEKEAS